MTAVIHARNCDCNPCRIARGEIVDEQAFQKYRAELEQFLRDCPWFPLATQALRDKLIDLTLKTHSACPEHTYDEGGYICTRCGFFFH